MATESPFGVSCRQLMELMGRRGKEGEAMLSDYEGVEGLAAHLKTDLKLGVSNDRLDLEARRREYGANAIPPVKPKPFLLLAFEALQDKTLIILIIAAVLSMVLGLTVEEDKNTAWIEGFAILSAVMIVVLVTAVNDWTKERQFRSLQKKLDTTSKFSVKRDGKEHRMVIADIVVGDLVHFGYGNAFPADGLVLEGNDIKVDESALTGESDLVKKEKDSNPFLLSGTRVMEGRGVMLVTAVGPHSQQGIIFQLMTQRDEEVGVFTKAYRKVRDKVLRRPKEGVDVENGENGVPPEVAEQENNQPGVTITEYEYDPDKPVSGEENGDSDDDESAVSGCDRWNLIKRVKLKKEEKEQDEEKKQKSSSGSASVLQIKLNKLAIQIGYGGTVAAIVCILVLTLKFVIGEFAIDERSWDSSTDYSELLHFVIIGITVLVVAVPEGLPLAVTIALAFSVKKMLKDNNLVRHLHACETMGNATAICSDKTGTLTTNRMTVVESYLAGTRYDVPPPVADIPENLLDALKLCIAVNSSYTSKLIRPGEEGDEEEEEEEKDFFERILSWLPWKKGGQDLLGQGLAKQVGNVTECALLGFLMELGIDYAPIREVNPTTTFTKVFTFNSARKSMSTVVPLPGGGWRLLTKGASEIILHKCSRIVGENGRVRDLLDEEKADIVTNVVQSMASHALRTICLAYRDFPPLPPEDSEITHEIDWDDEDAIVSNLTCLGIVGIQDPVRPEVPRCIRQCQEAGITVRMVTGDNVETARAIALKCGIISESDGYQVLEGKDFNKKVSENTNGEEPKVSQKKVDQIWPRLRVLARSSPQDKFVLVNGIIQSRLTKTREVVAVTGDGTNDGPALRRADVGFAMGIAGTDVAKEASDIILTDDNFASIVKAVMWGRNVYDSISKFLQFQLTINIVAVTLVLISAFSIGDSPLRAVQMLWVNLIMDTLASLALATEPPTEELLKRKPYGRTRSLISKQMWVFIFGHSLYQLIVMLVLVFAGEELFDIDNGRGRELRDPPTEHFTVVFNTFVFMQVFNEINARKIHGERNVFRGIHRNWIFLSVMVIQTGIQVIIVQFGDIVFSTQELTLDLWLWSIFLGSTELVLGQLLLFIPVRLIPDIPRPWKKETEEVVEEVDVLEDANRARYLWMKSLTRLRTQIRVVNAFRASLEQSPQIHLSQLPHYQATPRSHRYNPTGRETAV